MLRQWHKKGNKSSKGKKIFAIFCGRLGGRKKKEEEEEEGKCRCLFVYLAAAFESNLSTFPPQESVSLCVCPLFGILWEKKRESVSEHIFFWFNHRNWCGCWRDCCCRDWNSWFPSVRQTVSWPVNSSTTLPLWTLVDLVITTTELLSRCNQFISAGTISSGESSHWWSSGPAALPFQWPGNYKQSRAEQHQQEGRKRTRQNLRPNNLVANFFLQKKSRWRAHWHRFACLVTLDDEEDDNLRSEDRKCANWSTHNKAKLVCVCVCLACAFSMLVLLYLVCLSEKKEKKKTSQKKRKKRKEEESQSTLAKEETA